ncbi:MAG: 2Fe-2S iron-sulfur cluster-binding protein, partial [Pseudomonadota bacterium]
MTEPTFTFDGAPVPAAPGQSLAAALTAAGHRAFRQTAKGGTRGVFCGMGVCQDCLVTVDGVPNRRACMTKAAAGLQVETQNPFPALDAGAALPTPLPARTITPDVLVIGGGAGGLSAAIAARQAGADVVVLDERRVGGGQYYKQAAEGAPMDAQQREGATLLAKARASGAELLGGVEIWGAFDGPLILAEMDGTALIARPRTLIVATGAYERPVMVPGWTLPGVMTTGAAQTLWRSYRTLPGKRVIVCGSGPLNLQVALELKRGGADVRLVAEAAPAPWRKPQVAARMALADPGLTWKGLTMVAGLRRGGVPIANATRLTGIEAAAGGLVARFAGPGQRPREVETDAICMNAGFEPQNEILRLLGADMRYDPAFGHLRCVRSDTLETTIPGLYAIGDCAGLGGAPAARVEGRIAGRVAAFAARGVTATPPPADLADLARHRRFQAQLWRLYDVAPTSLHDAPGDMLLCRCEEVTLAEARAGYGANPGHLGTLKRGTRVGMGRCQGRYCGPVAARLIAEADGAPLHDRSFFAPRVPIKPVSIAAILAA